MLDGIGRSAKHCSTASKPTGCRLCQLGRSAIAGASFRWSSAGKSLVSAGKLPVSAGIPVEDCRKRGHCGAVASDCTLMGQPKAYRAAKA